jgi:hypothetical protein
MTKALNKRISEAFGTIYDRGDNGLEYMDKHTSLDAVLMEHFYNDTVDSLSKADKTKMAVMLESIVNDMEFDLESF